MEDTKMGRMDLIVPGPEVGHDKSSPSLHDKAQDPGVRLPTIGQTRTQGGRERNWREANNKVRTFFWKFSHHQSSQERR